ncbi:unnamed protein product [Blepharisma stoltei]|uniref:RING-type domain-containing protein n=1 Tax=Blepharisma stoltei TaxID=1481888 RepID=A0AAU9JLB9_9CILI|nr:unnamed protein product [Blepharisma stoltei]
MQADQISSDFRNFKVDAASQTEEKQINRAFQCSINNEISIDSPQNFGFDKHQIAPEQNKIPVLVSNVSNTEAHVVFTSKISCPVCLNAYDERDFIPKILSCGHTLCNDCLQSINNLGLIACPLCKKQERRSIFNIPTNFSIYEVNKAYKHVEFCELHNREAGLYCKTDHTLLCFDCIKSHVNHELYSLSDWQLAIIVDEKEKSISETELKLTTCISNYEAIFSQIQWEIEIIDELTEKHTKSYKEARIKIQKAVDNAMKKLAKTMMEQHNEKVIKSQEILDTINKAIIEADEKYKKFTEEKEIFEKANLLQKLGWKFNYDLSLDTKEFEDINQKFIEESEKPRNYIDDILKEVMHIVK